uniref:Galactosyltransferase C-terminal domain-containing protein n=1 Tax=Compsopogon caeruleus TaxID=31354 RepID=A0A7S1XGD2_9RHOD|mmetsp:Transcript_5947/g.11711  ORF Transcript_5947/g.11711 Transcript_5947/m.11711 type:complete len:709 (+) Transcript_5947:92-2218(+)
MIINTPARIAWAGRWKWAQRAIGDVRVWWHRVGLGQIRQQHVTVALLAIPFLIFLLLNSVGPASHLQKIQQLPLKQDVNVPVGVVLSESEFQRTRTILRYPTPKVSLVAACKDRSAFLMKTLSTWQAALGSTDEIILVDWSTSPGLMKINEIPGIRQDHRIKIISVQGQKTWILAQAFNLAAKFAIGESLLKVDCDTLLGAEFIARHPMPSRAVGYSIYYHLNWADARNENERHLNGVVFLPRTYFEAVRGYDERLVTYGWDDSDLYDRLERVGLRSRPLNLNFIRHLEHDDISRSANQGSHVWNLMFQTQINRVGLQTLPPWETSWMNNSIEYVYRAEDHEASQWTVVASNQVSGLIDRIDAAKYVEVANRARDAILHDQFDLPWEVLREIEVSNEELLDTLTREFPHGWTSKDGPIFAALYGSPETKLLALAEAVSLSHKYKRPLFVAWDPEGTQSKRKGTALRLSDFFNPAMTGTNSSGLLPPGYHSVFSLARWGCERSVTICVAWDSAYGKMEEYDSEGFSRLRSNLLDRLAGNVADQRHGVLLRLKGVFGIVSGEELAASLGSLVPSLRLSKVMDSFGNVRGSMGMYLGRGLSYKAQHAVATRLLAQARYLSGVFIIGDDEDAVHNVREMVGSMSIRRANESLLMVNPTEVRGAAVITRVAELYVMGLFCTGILHDGKSPSEVVTLVTALKSVKRAVLLETDS